MRNFALTVELFWVRNIGPKIEEWRWRRRINQLTKACRPKRRSLLDNPFIMGPVLMVCLWALLVAMLCL
jgi:hypothetical protein